MIARLLNRRKQRFREWWHAPATARDRVLGALVGGIGSFWLGVLGRIILGPHPISLETVAWWALGSVLVGMVIGLVFPKATTCLLFPFSTLGVGGGT